MSVAGADSTAPNLYQFRTIPPSRLRRATSLFTREALVPTIIFQITLLGSCKLTEIILTDLLFIIIVV